MMLGWQVTSYFSTSRRINVVKAVITTIKEKTPKAEASTKYGNTYVSPLEIIYHEINRF
ncbi:MAG: hypothetical protein U9M95_06540 [Candidatus Altiarchaeota archaeon]|nr:hypothetical protein [Candidatus Altiarchaeota archaeon]